MNNADTLQNIARMQSQMKQLDELYANTLNEINRLSAMAENNDVYEFLSKKKINDLTALKYSIFNEQLELGRVIMCELHAINY